VAQGGQGYVDVPGLAVLGTARRVVLMVIDLTVHRPTPTTRASPRSVAGCPSLVRCPYPQPRVRPPPLAARRVCSPWCRCRAGRYVLPCPTL
jgi:hypothetical protein